jgi:hypothetical protein
MNTGTIMRSHAEQFAPEGSISCATAQCASRASSAACGAGELASACASICTRPRACQSAAGHHLMTASDCCHQQSTGDVPVRRARRAYVSTLYRCSNAATRLNDGVVVSQVAVAPAEEPINDCQWPWVLEARPRRRPRQVGRQRGADHDPRLLVHLARSALCERLAPLEAAAGEAEERPGRLLRAADEQDLHAVFDATQHDDADANAARARLLQVRGTASELHVRQGAHSGEAMAVRWAAEGFTVPAAVGIGGAWLSKLRPHMLERARRCKQAAAGWHGQ